MRKVVRSCCIFLTGSIGLLTLPVRSDQPLPTAADVLQRVVERSQTQPSASSAAPYFCKKQTVTEEMDPEGRVTERKVKIGESKSAPGTHDANKWGRQNGVGLDEGLLRRFNFSVVDREIRKGRRTLVMTFVPKRPLAPIRHLQDHLLNRAMGTIWVDEEDNEMVKADIRLGEPVSFGLLGAVEELSFSFELARSEEGGWLTQSSETYVKARKFLKPFQLRKRVDCSDFHKLAAAKIAVNPH
jgi:hypothetical protein